MDARVLRWKRCRQNMASPRRQSRSRRTASACARRCRARPSCVGSAGALRMGHLRALSSQRWNHGKRWSGCFSYFRKGWKSCWGSAASRRVATGFSGNLPPTRNTHGKRAAYMPGTRFPTALHRPRRPLFVLRRHAATTPEASGKKRLFRGRKPGVAAWDIAIVAVVALMFPVAILKRHRQVSAGMRKHKNACRAHKPARACCLASITDNTHRRNPCLPILAAPGAGQSAI